MKCQNLNCNNQVEDTKLYKQKKTCSKQCSLELRMYNTRVTRIEKYGSVSGPARTQESIEQAKNTCLLKYGVENPSQSQSIKDKKMHTCMEHHGVENPLRSPILQNKGKNTKLERYGSETYNNRDKAKETMIERFGHDHAMQSPTEVEKLRQVFISKYGVDNPSQAQSVKDKKVATYIERYGVDNPSHSPELLKRIINNSYRKKIFIMPSGKEITLMGFEPVALSMLLNGSVRDTYGF